MSIQPTPVLRNFTVNGNRALGEVSRFFGGWDATLRELFQNAYRASATEVVVTANANASVVTFQDNGCGCDYAGLTDLLEAFSTGWDETQVVQPAGLGFFSLFNPEIIQRVTVRSGDWKLERDNRLPMSAGAQEQHPLPAVTGFAVTLEAVEAHDEFAANIAEARAFYPFRVTLNGADVPAHMVQAAITLDLPGPGRVAWAPDGPYYTSNCHAIWEWRPISSITLYHTLNAACGHLPPELAPYADHLLSYTHWWWWVDPACGVTPRLPDRSELEANPKLDAAAREIVRALAAEIRRQALEVVAGYPALFTKKPALPAPLAHLEHFVDAALAERGWHALKEADLSSLRTWCSYDDGWILEVDIDRDVTVWDRSPLTGADADLLTLAQAYRLGLVGHAVMAAGDAPAVTFRGLRKAKGDHYVAVADRILWNDVALPFYLVPEADETSDRFGAQARVVLAGGWAAAVQLLQSKGPAVDMVLGHITRAIDRQGDWWALGYDWADWSDDGGVRQKDMAADLVREVTADFATAADRRRLAEYDLLTVHLDQMQAAHRQLTYTPNGRKSPVPLCPSLAPTVKALTPAIAATLARRNKTAAALRRRGLLA